MFLAAVFTFCGWSFVNRSKPDQPMSISIRSLALSSIAPLERNQRCSVLISTCLLLGGLGVSPLACADASVTTDLAIEEILVTGSLEGRVGDIGSLTTLDADQLDLIRPTHISETLSRVAGAWVSRGSGQEHLTAIRSPVLTGAGACGEFLFLENGVPIRPAGFCNINNLFEVNHEQASGIEVMRGPAGALFGGNAVHGAINVVQRTPEAGLGLSVEGGPFDYYQVRGEYGAEFNGQSIGVKALSTSTNGFRDDTGYSQQKLVINHDAEVGRWQVTTLLSATLLNQETGGFVLGFEAFEDNDLQDSNPNPEAFRDAWSLRASSRWQTEIGDNSFLSITPYIRRSGMAFFQHFLPGQPLETNDQTSGGVTAQFGRVGERYSATVGVTLELLDGALKEDQEGPTLGSAFLIETRPEGLHYDYEVESLLAALFYNVDYELTDRVSLVHSLRVETLNYDYENLFLTGNTREDGTECGFGGCLYTRPPSGEDDFTNVAGRLGVNYEVNDRLATYATFSTGFRPPQATELYRLQNGQETTDLNSERLRSFEVGARWVGEAAQVEVAAYFDDTDDFIFRDGEGFNVSNGATRSQGIEVSAEYALGEAHGFDIVVSYARHKYDFDGSFGAEPISDGDDVDTAPRWLGSARWRYQPTKALTSELELTGVGQHYINAANTADYDGHVVFNWRGGWQARDNLRVFARVINLLDEEYADRADFAFGNFRYFPGLPRQLYVGVEFTPRRSATK